MIFFTGFELVEIDSDGEHAQDESHCTVQEKKANFSVSGLFSPYKVSLDQSLEQVPDEIPRDCDVAVVFPDKDCESILLKKEEVAQFKKSVLENSCPCQDGLGGCPMQENTDANLGILFDVHVHVTKMPFAVKYICHEFGKRHYHSLEFDRINCRMMNYCGYQTSNC